MGYQLAWIAMRSKSREEVLHLFGLRTTGEHEEFPESDITGLLVQPDWCIILVNLHGDGLERLRFGQANGILSQGCEHVYCYVHERTMMSCASAWYNSDEVWTILHNGGNIGILHLEVFGDIPNQYDSIRERLVSLQYANGGEQATVDYIFDVPIEVAASVTGFRHDREVSNTEDEPIEVLTFIR